MKETQWIDATPDDAMNLFWHSEGIRQAVIFLFGNFEPAGIGSFEDDIPKKDIIGMSKIVPVVVLSALHLELLLKVLQILEKNKFHPIHQLDTLFDELGPKHKQSLEEGYNAIISECPVTQQRKSLGHDESINGVLQRSRNAFVDFRYYPTKKLFLDKTGFVATNVSTAARDLVLKINKSWKLSE